MLCRAGFGSCIEHTRQSLQQTVQAKMLALTRYRSTAAPDAATALVDALLAFWLTFPNGLQLMMAIVEAVKTKRAKSLLSTVMIVGVPNCGKSSIINAMKKAAKKQGGLAVAWLAVHEYHVHLSRQP